MLCQALLGCRVTQIVINESNVFTQMIDTTEMAIIASKLRW